VYLEHQKEESDEEEESEDDDQDEVSGTEADTSVR